MPWPGAGTNSSGRARAPSSLAPEPLQPGAREHDRVEARRRRRACAAACRRCRASPTTSRSSRAARSCAARRRLLVPTRAPGGSAPSRPGAAEHVLGAPRAPGRRAARARRASSAGDVLGGVHREVDLAVERAPPRARATQRDLSSRAAPRSPLGRASGRSRRAAERLRRPARPARARARCAGCRSASALAAAAQARGPRAQLAPAACSSRCGSAVARAARTARAASSRLAWPRSRARLRRRIVGSCSSRLITARAIASTRARSRAEADSQRPAFSAEHLLDDLVAALAQRAIVGSASSWPSQRAKRWISSSTISSARAAPRRRALRGCARRPPAGRRCRTASRPSSSPQARVDVARHRDVDQQQRAVRRASRITSSSSSRPTIGCGEEVEREHDVGAPRAARAGRRARRPCRRSAGRGRARRSAWRLATKIVPAPLRRRARCAVSSLVSPAPMITTWRAAQVAEHAQRELDGDRGTLTRLRADRRSPRARACRSCSAAANRRLRQRPGARRRASRASCARLTWPWISASPTIIDSSPAVTRKRWRAASQLRGE